MRARVVAFVAMLGVACGSKDKSAAEIAVEANAELLCDRLFSCCTPTELASFSFVDEERPPTHDGCIAYHTKSALGYLPSTDDEAAHGRVAVHVERSAACVEARRAETCGQFYRRLPRLHLGDAYALCNDQVVEPLVANDAACKLYLDCQGGSCVGAPAAGADAGAEARGTCRDLPEAGAACGADGCSAGFTCEPETETCQPYLGDGAACRNDDACASGACLGGRCASPGRCGG